MTQRERQILQWIEADPMISQEQLAEKAGKMAEKAGRSKSATCAQKVLDLFFLLQD